jgi:hypothetical protein
VCHRRSALPKSALAKAVWYARNQWQALCRYTEDGRLSIDNNVSERTLRHQAIGRKNWLFLGSAQAGSSRCWTAKGSYFAVIEQRIRRIFSASTIVEKLDISLASR